MHANLFADEFMMIFFPCSFFLILFNLSHSLGTFEMMENYGNVATEAERRFKSIREKYRRRKILLERDVSNNVEHSKLKRWDLYSKLGFLDDYMIPRK